MSETSEARTADGPSGIGGWLVVVLLLLGFSVAQLVYTYSALALNLAGPDAAARLEAILPEEAVSRATTIGELIMGLVLAPLCIFAIVAILQQKRFVPGFMVALYALAAATGSLALIRALFFLGVGWFRIGFVSTTFTILALLATINMAMSLAWLRYFQLSKRVKNTFVR